MARASPCLTCTAAKIRLYNGENAAPRPIARWSSVLPGGPVRERCCWLARGYRPRCSNAARALDERIRARVF